MLFKKFLQFSLIFTLALGWVFPGWMPLWLQTTLPPRVQLAYAAATVTTATGGSAISADTTGGSYTTLTGPTITEGSNRDVPASGTIVLNAPSGFSFNTGATVAASIVKDNGTGTCFTFSSANATPAATTITYTVTARDSNTNTRCHVTFSNIQVRPTAGTPLASGNITHTGTASIVGMTSSTNLGTLTEVVGAKNKLAVTTQPSASATIATDFSTKPVVKMQDQYGNTVTSDNSSTITRTVVLSAQVCGGTAGSGTLTSTPASGSAVTGGILTYTAMQYSAVEGIKICFTSSGVTSALSTAITVSAGAPTVTTQAASSVTETSATGNGTITSTGGENADKRGFVYDAASKSLPGNVTPGSSGYASFAEDTGSFSAAAFTKALTGFTGNITRYLRAYAHNSTGYSYGGEVSFLTLPATAGTPTFSNIGETTVTVSWTAPSGGAASYKIERCSGSGCSNFSEIVTGHAVTSFNDSGLNGSTVYRYRVRATNATGDGAYSSVGETTTTIGSVVSVTLTSDGTISYGFIPAGGSNSTISLSDTQTIKNDGTVGETFSIKGQNSACPWTLGTSSGNEQYMHEFSTNSGSSWEALTGDYQVIATGVLSEGIQNFDLRITVPSVTACFGQQAVDVTVVAILDDSV